MATKISELNTSIQAVANDLFITVVNAANAATIESKKITFQGMANSLPGILNLSGSNGIVIDTTTDANAIGLSVNGAVFPRFSSFTITNPETNVSHTQAASSNDALVIETGRNFNFSIRANNTITLGTFEGANGENIDLTANSTHEIFSLANNPSIVGNTTLGTDSTNITTFNSIPILPSVNTTVRDALTAVDGMMIYNTEDTKAQVRAGGAWANLH